MKKSSILTYFLSVAVLCLTGISCNLNSSHEADLEKTLEPVEEVTFINGTENTTITVNKTGSSLYEIMFKGVGSNNIIADGNHEGWCLDWQTPIESDNGTYEGIKLYSTYRVEKWKPINYFLNIRDELKEQYPEVTWREFQIAIWSLRANPPFDLETISVEDLPAVVKKDGQPNFSYDLVNQILAQVESGHQNFEYEEGVQFAVIAETPVDVQTLFTVVE
ncbi:hypothetical protein ACG2F4_19060 [Halalkalibaculum sp. DA3122]|uniref:hypothetical protein n=1 Tax=Halalkalibaculum sp. DA3122 TaxID=3373607 RepID=UPI00375436B5